jgi:hypothetical protein
VEFGGTEFFLDVLMKYSTFINCRLANELNNNEIAHKVRLHPSVLSKLMKSEILSHLNPSNAKTRHRQLNNQITSYKLDNTNYFNATFVNIWEPDLIGGNSGNDPTYICAGPQ